MIRTADILSIITIAAASIVFVDIAWSAGDSDKDEIASIRRAAEFGDWVGNWTADKGPIEVGGSYSASWRKVDGVWKIQSEIFVTLFCNGAAC
jgi:hypothetical protein